MDSGLKACRNDNSDFVQNFLTQRHRAAEVSLFYFAFICVHLRTLCF